MPNILANALRRTRLSPLLIALAFTALVVTWLGTIVFAAGPSTSVAEVTIEARQFSYDPAVVHVAEGQLVRITLRAMDVTHGLYVDEYGASVKAIPGRPDQFEFVANKTGQFRFRCTQTCGPLHPFMVGKLVVEPNRTFPGALAIAFLLSLGTLGMLWLRSNPRSSNSHIADDVSRSRLVSAAAGSMCAADAVGKSGAVGRTRGAIAFDLLKLPISGPFLRWRGFQFALMLPFLLFLMLVMVAGLRGTAVGSHNLAIVFVWIAWWPLLILILLPLGGRIWCAVCPIPAPGEWLQRLAFIQKPARSLSLAKRWPAKLRNMWLQNVAFLFIALFSAVILTTPSLTAIVLASFFIGALILSLVFAGRSFCRYVCPLGGFIGLCSLASPMSVRVKDRAVCLGHREKECIRGSEKGYGCPWFEYPGTMDRNAYCGLCMECVKTCPKGNIAVGLQAPGRDLAVDRDRADEAYRTFIALGSAVLYSAVMLGPWGWLKSLAGTPLAPGFGLYAGILLGTCLVIVPGLFFCAAWLGLMFCGQPGTGAPGTGGAAPSARQLWQKFSYALVPMALMAWIAFSLSLVLASGNYLVPVLSDPLGHGWNLFGTADFEGAPLLMGFLPYLQTLALLIGLVWSIVTAWRISARTFRAPSQALRALLPVTGFLLSTTVIFLWLFLG